MNRREFLVGSSLATAAAITSSGFAQAATQSRFKLNYLVGSSMYGELPLSDILPAVRKTGSDSIDIWPRSHGNQREQVEEMGHEEFAKSLARSRVNLGCITRYDLGPFGLKEEFKFAGKFECPLIVCGGKGPKGLKGSALKQAVKAFTEKLKPHLEIAKEHGVSLAIENHGNNLINTPDSLKWLMELRPATNLKVALAPYHLETLGVDAPALGKLISQLGNNIGVFYAWQHGMGCMKKLPKEQELLQLPGRGKFDFAPAIQALQKVAFNGFTEIFMHPVPRGIPILPTAQQTTAEINKSRAYLEAILKRA